MNTSKLKRDWKKSCGKAKDNPNSIWEQLEALEGQRQKHVPERPANSVTAKEYGAKFGHTDSWGHRRLRDLVAQGKLKTVRWGRQNVYVLVAPLP